MCSNFQNPIFSLSFILSGHENVNLIVARGNRIDVQLVSPEGLKNVCEIPIYGQVLTIALVKCKRDVGFFCNILTFFFEFQQF